ncbi:hypothetical protein CTI14_19395, partial [Methylobacterium radiotolerans]
CPVGEPARAVARPRLRPPSSGLTDFGPRYASHRRQDLGPETSIASRAAAMSVRRRFSDLARRRHGRPIVRPFPALHRRFVRSRPILTASTIRDRPVNAAAPGSGIYRTLCRG